ncbi:anthranilate phosphoribosyltransferase [Chromatiales bacterium (ex Bugula neritina AB1)]|nr:anthranilate phosphoribosyltransferase [Chromatiales bacterium (ex Bugula neritina AB1)]
MTEVADIRQLIAKVTDGNDLDVSEMVYAMRQLMSGGCSDAQIGGLLVALRSKGESVEEVAAAAKVMRELASGVQCESTDLLDIVGTGGDGSSTFNVSTTSALVAAAAGVKVAKHGNRAVSSSSGAADLLEAAGVNIELDATDVAYCVDKVGLGFMFAPRHHGAMRFAIGPRKELGMRTIFNVLGPLTNPASAPRQVMGVYSQHLVEPMTQVLQKLGSVGAMVVHGQDGMDEISIGAPTCVSELKNGRIESYVIEPEQFSMTTADTAAIQVSSAEESLDMVRQVLDGGTGAARDIVALNAGAAIYVAGLAEDHQRGVERALQLLSDGSVKNKLAELVSCSNEKR